MLILGAMTVHFPFQNTYAALPADFFARVAPTPVISPRLIKLNRPLAVQLGLDPDRLDSPEGAEILAGKRVPDGADPIAMAYAGHQFGHFVPQLGDGRAILLGEVIDADGVRRDIQLKGSGPTPFSRRGDGRAALGPVLREYIVSEAMAALGIPTTRALAAVTTGEPVWREKPLPGADAIRRLADHVIARHYPEAVDAANRYRTLLDLVISRQAALMAKWQLVGFIHGVMNTDNMSIAGETIDYGPCAFMDVYHPETVYSSIDKMGRYAYGNQPRIAQWNLARLAETFLPLLAEDKDAAVKEAQEAIDAFAAGFETAYAAGLSRKLGLFQPRPDDVSLAQDLLERMARNGADFTLIFRRLCDAAASPDGDAAVRSLFTDPSSFDDWAARWHHRLAEEGGEAKERRAAMRAAKPAFIPRNHLVEEAISAAVNVGDFQPFENLLTVLSMPYQDKP